jgi:hypothetical protein
MTKLQKSKKMQPRIKARRENAQISLPIVGNIRIGEKKPGTNYPSSIDYFIIDAPAEYREQVTKIYGERPKVLKVVFPSENMADVCRNYYELRDKDGKRIADGDGESFRVATKQGDGTVRDIITTPANSDEWMQHLQTANPKSVWRERLTIRFMILGTSIVGVWQLNTGGKESSIPNILNSIDAVKATFERIKLVPFNLEVEMAKSDKSGSTSKFPVLQLVCNLSVENAQAVRQLPANFAGIVRNETVMIEAPKSEAEPTTDYVDYEEIETVNETTLGAEMAAIMAMVDRTAAAEKASTLKAKAEAAGFKFDKSQNGYVKIQTEK